MISRTPASASRRASPRIGATGRDSSGPRVYGTTQNVQNLSQPSWIVRKADGPVARGRGRRGKLVLELELGVDHPLASPRPRQHVGQAVIALRPDDDVDRTLAA